MKQYCLLPRYVLVLHNICFGSYKEPHIYTIYIYMQPVVKYFKGYNSNHDLLLYLYIRLVYTLSFYLDPSPNIIVTLSGTSLSITLARTTLYLAGHQSHPFPSCICPCHHCFARVQYHEAVLDCNR